MSQYLTLLKDGAFFVYGLGLSGRAVAHALLKARSHVLVWDDDAASREGLDPSLRALLRDPSSLCLKGMCVVVAPGIDLQQPRSAPLYEQVKRFSLEVVCDVELFWRAYKRCFKWVGVTGTNGKSTVTALISHLLRASSLNAPAAGNIGSAVFDIQDAVHLEACVLELSSFQIERMPTASLDVALFLNLSPDHIDRHHSLEAYGAIKVRLFEQLGADGLGIIGCADSFCRHVFKRLYREKNLVPVGSRADIDALKLLVQDQDQDQGVVARAVTWVGRDIIFEVDGKEEGRITCVNDQLFPGEHGLANVAAACAACVFGLHLSLETVAKALPTFHSLPHRFEIVGTLNDITFINDSKATNSDAAVRALEACAGDIYWIVGGRAKESRFHFPPSSLARISHAFLIGDASSMLLETLSSCGVPCSLSQTLDRAFKEAIADAQAHEEGKKTIVLAPACTSYDQFKNFEERGNSFRQLVQTFIETSVKEHV